ncbi:MAG TPA: tetratricopeptide repeat protein [Longimicrobium sp.]|jgi:tetratricopeptide (TPR) repeat protein|nr:tetratricopeptide repeat protein [Longimicrobium sp.]
MQFRFPALLSALAASLLPILSAAQAAAAAAPTGALSRPRIALAAFSYEGDSTHFRMASYLPGALAMGLAADPRFEYVEEGPGVRMGAAVPAVYDSHTAGAATGVDLVLSGTLVELGGQLWILGELLHVPSGRAQVVSSPTVPPERLLSTIDQFAEEVRAAGMGMYRGSSAALVGVACFTLNGDAGETANREVGVELGQSLSMLLRPATARVAPWPAARRFCRRPLPDGALLDSLGTDWLVRGSYSVHDAALTVEPRIVSRDGARSVQLLPIEGTLDRFFLLELQLREEVTEALDQILSRGLSFSFPEEAAAGPDAQLEQAARLSSAGSDYAARLLLTRLVREHPDHTDGHAALARLLAQQERYEEAVTEYGEVLRLRPADTLAYLELGDVYLELDEFDRAAQWYQAMLDRRLGSPAIARARLGRAYLFAGDYDEAIRQYRAAEAAGLRSAGLLADLGSAFRAADRAEDAIAAYTRSLQLDSTLQSAKGGLAALHRDRGVRYLQERRDSLALAEFQSVLRFDPAEAYPWLTYVLTRLRRFDEVVATAEEAIRRGHTHSHTYNNLGVALRTLGFADSAVAVYSSAIAADSSNSTAYVNRAIAMWDSGHKTAAARLLGETARRFPDQPDIQAEYAGVLRHTGQLTEALAVIDGLLRVHPDSARFRLIRGITLHVLGRPQEAIAEYEWVLRNNPRDSLALNNIASTYADMGMYAEAVRAADRAINLAPGFANAYSHMGFALHRLGRTAEGDAMFATAVRLNPNYAGPVYYRARLAAIAGDLTMALVHLEQAVANDPEYAVRASSEPDLAALRQDPGFQTLLDQARAR